MDRDPAPNTRQQATLVALLGIALLAPVLLSQATGLSWLPGWFGASMAIGALLAALGVFWRTGAMRGGYVVLFVLALAVAAVLGRILTAH